MTGLAAALWLLGLCAAAPSLRTEADYTIADRLRDALIIGIAIPFVLGLFHLLYPAACWCALAVCLILGYRRQRATGAAVHLRPWKHPPYVLIAALVAVAWPQLMRPLLDGDSLSYHLPNAAAWVQSHSMWSTQTRYWWYPSGSELFAAGLYAVATPFALPWCGFGALALLGLRVAAWAREEYGAPPLFCDALAAAVVTAFPLAIQGGTLQNDVWLAAFLLETLWSLRIGNGAPVAARAAPVSALIKPQGWLFTGIGLVALRAPPRVWLAAAVALSGWIVRDAVLWKHALAVPAATISGALLGSTIVAHGIPALAMFARVSVQASPFAAVAFCTALFAPAITHDRRIAWAAVAAALTFFVLPFGYTTAVAQLASGASLRFAAPAIALGAVILAGPASRLAGIASAVLLASTAFGVWMVLATFYNDGGTHIAIPIAMLATALAVAAFVRQAAWPSAVGAAVAIVAATHLAARHPLDYYDDALTIDGTKPGIYRWIELKRPAAIGGLGLRLGVVNVLSPATLTVDLPDLDACTHARDDGVLLTAVAESDRSREDNARRLQNARACGPLLYSDSAGVIVSPAAR